MDGQKLVWGRGEAFTSFGGNPEGNRPLGRPRRKWEDKINFQEVGCGGMGWIELAQYRDRCRALAIVVMNPRVPQNAGNFLTI
jgi:hypothetical protein